MRESRVLWVESERDKSLETTSFILQIPQTNQVIGAVVGILEVPVEHSCIASEPKGMSYSMNFKPFFSICFMFADFIPYFGMKDLSASTWKTSEAS
jgi:hypothetical protein